MYKLYYSPGACSMAVHVLLNEIGAKAETEAVNLRAPRSPEFLKINPRGSVPALIVDGKVMLEGAAILTYLADTHQSPLLPSEGWARAQALQWLMFANSTLHPAYSRALWLAAKCKIEDKGTRDDLAAQACDIVQSIWDQVEEHLSQAGPYLCGKDCTLGDILVTVIANWSFLPRQFSFGPKTKELLKAVSSKPSYQKALKAEGIEYKAAA